jgi:hypothetical protein
VFGDADKHIAVPPLPFAMPVEREAAGRAATTALNRGCSTAIVLTTTGSSAGAICRKDDL